MPNKEQKKCEHIETCNYLFTHPSHHKGCACPCHTPTESTTECDCLFKTGNRCLKCETKWYGSSPTKPDTESWEELKTFLLEMDELEFAGYRDKLFESIETLVHQVEEKSYERGRLTERKSDQEWLAAARNDGRQSAYREMEEVAETDYERFIINKLKEKLTQK